MSETHLQLKLQSDPTLSIKLGQNRDNLKLKLSPPVAIGGTTDYNDLENKPRINGVILKNDKSLSELGMQEAGDYPDSPLSNLEIEELINNFA